ncbi:DUF3948 family protein, partial [Bacillus tropicus]
VVLTSFILFLANVLV